MALVKLADMKLRMGGPSRAVSGYIAEHVLIGLLAVNAGCSSAGPTTADALSAPENPPSLGGGQSGDEGVTLPIPPTPPAVPQPGTRPSDEPPSREPHPEAIAASTQGSTHLDVETLEFEGIPIDQYLSRFGGERPAHWLPEVDATSPSILIPSPGPTDVALTVNGAVSSARYVIRTDGVSSYLLTLPMRLRTSDGRLDVSFTAEMGLLETGEAWLRHTFTEAELDAVTVRVPDGSPGAVHYALSVNLWSGGSAGSLSASIVPALDVSLAQPSGAYTLQNDAPPPPTPPGAPPPEPIGPPAGSPDPWQPQRTPGTLLAWPNGKRCDNANGIDHTLDGLTPRTLIELLSHLEELTIERATEPSATETSRLTVSVAHTPDDVCVSTKRWRGSLLDRLAVTVDVRVTEEASGLDLTLPVEVAALHTGGEIDTVFFANSLNAWTWAPTDGPPTIDGSNLHTLTGLSGSADAYAVFPLITGRVRNNGESLEADGQLLLAVPTRDVDGNTNLVTDLNLAAAEMSEVQALFTGGDWTGVESVLFDGVWTSGGSEP